MIKFLNYPKLFQPEKAEIMQAIEKVIDSGQFVLGEEVEKFEKNLANYVGTKYALGLNSGTDALFLALKALGIGKGDEVITVSHTFIATIQTIAETGATPILVDIHPNTGLIDINKVQSLITNKTKAIIPVHLEGKVCDMPSLRSIVDFIEAKNKQKIYIIEDAAQALGGEYGNGQKTGSMGDIGCFSFYPAKIMGTLGDAGAITTNDEAIYKEIYKLRNHYLISKNLGVENDTVKFGYNSRLDSILAAVLNVRFTHLDEILERRKEIASIYNEELKDLPITLPYDQEGRVWQDYVIRAKNRNDLKKFLNDNGIGTLGDDLMPNHFYKGLALDFILPYTEEYIYSQMRLPCNPTLTDEDIKEVCAKIKEFYA